jgi:hypothetical protein
MRYARAVVFLAIALSALRAYAGPPFSCCYCTSPTSGNQALLCEVLATGDMVDFQAMCEARGGDMFPCVAAISPASCPGVFSERGIICPEAAAAPTLSSGAIVLLAGLLICLGVAALRARLRSNLRSIHS